MKQSSKIFVVLVTIVLFPALFYSAYQISTLNESEDMMQQIYSRQLDAILFSVNQYILDVASNWATQVENDLPSGRFLQLLQTNGAIVSIAVTDSTLRTVRTYPEGSYDLRNILPIHKDKIDRLLRYRSVEYRKLEPVILSDSSFMILFVGRSKPSVIGIVINNSRFINGIIARKLNELSQDEFLFAVVKRSTNAPVYATSSFPVETISAKKQLWIFPDYVLGIRIRGETLSEILHDRYNRNLVLIIFLDIVLLAGILLVYRTIKKEMELIALKSDFVSNVSHELRTPLSLIRMFSETLEMGRVKTEKKKHEYYGIILHETERLTRLINNILNFSRMESNTRKYSFRPTNINDVISSVLEIYTYQLEHLKFTVQRSLDKDLPTIPADEEAIAEALYNLIDNAIKYSKTEKFLRIETSWQTESITIQIEDHGIGIPMEFHTKIFEKFYRVSHGLVHTAKGSGLGLAIVQHIVSSHSGTIRIASEVNKGSTFTIVLPLLKLS